ncbi:uncharacterized protein [Leptinotarsa decemlineata]|uniref:uncharacterized protein n=1 Tax=Leptinotarsa decemlineata TaxID=7539 RepID=UPI003D306399
MLLTGRELKLPLDVLCGSPFNESQEVPISEFVNDLKETLEIVHEFARTKLQLSSDRMKIRFDKKSLPVSFKEGDAVWLYQHQRRKGVCPKLQIPWQGPYLVTKKINDLVYRIQLSPSHQPQA